MREGAGYSVEKVSMTASTVPLSYLSPPPGDRCYVGCFRVLPCVVACEWAVQKGRWAFPPLISHSPTVAPIAQPGGDSTQTWWWNYVYKFSRQFAREGLSIRWTSSLL